MEPSNRWSPSFGANSFDDAVDRLPDTLRSLARSKFSLQTADGLEAKLVVLNGDCAKPDFGLDDRQLEMARQANILINAAADTRFTLPLADAVGGVVSIATYLSSRIPRV